MRLVLTREIEWKFDIKILKDQFPDEYNMHKKDGKSDEDFAVETLLEMGEDSFMMIFGQPKIDDTWVDYFE